MYVKSKTFLANTAANRIEEIEIVTETKQLSMLLSSVTGLPTLTS